MIDSYKHDQMLLLWSMATELEIQPGPRLGRTIAASRVVDAARMGVSE